MRYLPFFFFHIYFRLRVSSARMRSYWTNRERRKPTPRLHFLECIYNMWAGVHRYRIVQTTTRTNIK